jgi:hypothetical protein
MKRRILLMPSLALLVWLTLGVGSAQQSGRPTPKPKPSPKDDCCVLEPLSPNAPNDGPNDISRSTEMKRLVEGNAAEMPPAAAVQMPRSSGHSGHSH